MRATRRRSQRPILPAAVLLCAQIPAFAAGPPLPPRSRVYLPVALYVFDAEDNHGQLEDEGSSFAIGLGYGYRVRRYLDLQGELLGARARFDNATVSAPPLGSVSDRVDLKILALVARARGVYPFRRVEPFIAAGIGFGHAELSVSGNFLGIPGIAREVSDSGLLYDLSAGAHFIISEHLTLGFEYRGLQMEAEFDTLSRGQVDIGGNLYGVVANVHLMR